MPTQTPLSETPHDENSYCVFGAATIVARIRELRNNIAGAKKNEDIEYVHKLRVASRRLRAAMSVFKECFPNRELKFWKKTVKNLTSSCGAARDADVLIAFLQDYSRQATPRAVQGVRYLIRKQRRRRREMQSSLVKILDSVEASGILTEMTSECTNLQTARHTEDGPVATLSMYQSARAHVGSRLDELSRLKSFVHDPNAFTKHHELRIAAKRLRYTMEIFSSIYPTNLQQQIDEIKQFQDILGEMHDYYVWSEDLQRHRREAPDYAKYGVNRLLRHLRTLRSSKYSEFVALWDASATKLSSKIRAEVDRGPEPAKNQENNRVTPPVH